MSEPLAPAAALRVFLLLTLTRWFGTGLVAALLILWYLERGLTVTEALTLGSLTGIAVVALELPTSGFADAFGRRPVYLAAALAQVLALGALALAGSWGGFAVAAVLMGVFRALDSGPLEAWYVDTVHATAPGADVDRGLAHAGTMLGAAVAAGSLLAGGLVAWHPLASRSALELPIVVAAALALAHLVAIALLMREPTPTAAAATAAAVTGGAWSRAARSVREAPAVIRSGLGLLRHNPVLRSLVLVEVFWVWAMVVFEHLQPIRLADLVGGEAAAGQIQGPVTAAGWVVFALGSWLAGRTSVRIGITRTAMLGRVLNGLGALVMGLVVGPVGLVAAYLVTYGMHGFCGPMHSALLHREASAGNRATVMSINSMVFFGAFGLVAPLLGLLGEARSVPVAMVVGGAVSVVGVLLYLPALRAERAKGADPAAAEADSPPVPSSH